MRKSILAAGVLSLVIAATVPAAAQRTPGVEEAGAEQRVVPLGLVLNPTAYTLPTGQWLIGAGTFQQTVPTSTASRQWSLGAFRGASPRWQYGGFYANVRSDLAGGGHHTGNFFGASTEWNLVPETGAIPAFSLGGDIFTGDGTGGTAFGVLSKNFASSVRPGAVIGHLGLRYDTFNHAIGFSGRSNDWAPFVGANVIVTDRLSLNGEIRKKHPWETDAPWAAGASFMLENYVISAGLQNIGHNRTKLYAGLSLLP